MIGIGNQLLAVIGLGVGTTYLLQHASKRRYALCTAIPFVAGGRDRLHGRSREPGTWWLRQAIPRSTDADGVFLPADVRWCA